MQTRRAALLSFLWLSAIGGAAAAEPSAVSEFAPSGKLRVALIGSNPVLVSRTPDGKLGGVSVALGRFIAEQFGVAFEPVVYQTPAAYTQSFAKGEWDLGIGGKDPSRAEKLDFSPDFMLVDDVFVAAPGRTFASTAEVDRPGIRVAVPNNSAPDHFLTHALKSAELVRVPGGLDRAVAALKGGEADVYAENAYVGNRIAELLRGASIVPGQFNTVHMAVAAPKGRSPAALAALAGIVEEAKKKGVVANAITAAGLRGVRPAPE